MVRTPPLIAVVDDDAHVRTALQRLLRSTGYAVEGFASGVAFLASCEAGMPDCLVLDLHMPGMSGFDVQRELAGRGSAVPVVVITGQDSPTARARAQAGGVCEYLCKPFDRDELVGAVERALAVGARA